MIRPSIQASWKKLLLVNYDVDPEILNSYLPYNTELAFHKEKCFVSLVGFLFLNVSLMGIQFPFHTNFLEVNLRFYVRRLYQGEWRYGVVFIKEIVALPIVSLIASKIAGENYVTHPMKNKITRNPDTLYVEYSWKKKRWHSFDITCEPTSSAMIKNSAEDFFTSQFWGYTKLKGNIAYEYSVEHPTWEIYKTLDYNINVDYALAYGDKFEFLNKQNPDSVFLAEGSPIYMQKEKTMRPG